MSITETRPKRLYKYQSLSERALHNLNDNVVWFSNPHFHFNDPFDCLAVIPNPIISDKEAQEECARSGIDNADVARWNLELGLEAQLHCRIWNDVSVACFSESVDDILMWSHYADGHTGFCLEFDTSIAPFTDAQPVIYRETFPRLKLSQIKLESTTSEQLTSSLLRRMLLMLTKYKGWKYEKEWRIIRSKNAHMERFDKKRITGVYIGAKMPFQGHDELLAVTKDFQPIYRRMFRVPQKFKVSPVTVTFGSRSVDECRSKESLQVQK